MDRLKFYTRETLALLAVAALVAATVVALTHLYAGVLRAFWPDAALSALIAERAGRPRAAPTIADASEAETSTP
jgi:hypothetical protein